MSQGHVCLVQLMYATVIFRLNVMSEMACFQATTFNAHDNTVIPWKKIVHGTPRTLN